MEKGAGIADVRREEEASRLLLVLLLLDLDITSCFFHAPVFKEMRAKGQGGKKEKVNWTLRDTVTFEL